MYRLINRHCNVVLARLESGDEVSRYTALCAQLASGRVDPETNMTFQRDYRRYWGVQRRSATFCARYFRLLAQCTKSRDSDVASIVHNLARGRKGKKPSLEFSFATKIAHMVDPRVPVFDSLVAAFYFYVKPPSEKSFDDRLRLHLEFHTFLRDEYARAIKGGLLGASIQAFRSRFPQARVICDERVVDWLLWAWASLLRDGAQRDGDLLFD